MNIPIEERIKMLTDLGLVFSVGDDNSDSSYDLKDICIFSAVIEETSDEDYTTLVDNVKQFMRENPADYPNPDGGTQELSIIDKAKETLLSGSAILQKNQQKAAKFVSAAQALITSIKENGDELNEELDKKANEAILKIGVAVKEVDEETKPLRQAMVFIRDQLKACENDMAEQAKIIQGYRNAWAAKCERIRKENEERERKEQEKRQEVILVRSMIEKGILTYFNDHLLAKKQAVNNWFNSITLDNFEERSKSLTENTPVYDPIHFRTFTWRYTGSILQGEEITAIIEEVRSEEKYQQFAQVYVNDMSELRTEKIDMLPSKKAELERIAAFAKQQEEERKEQERIAEEQKTANEARQKELEELKRQSEEKAAAARQQQLEEEQAQAAREAEEREEQERIQQEKMQQEQSMIDVSAAQQQSMSLFEEKVSTTPSTTGPKAKVQLKAIITKPVGIYALFQLWMENVGMHMTPEELTAEFSKLFTYANKRANDKKAPLMLASELSGTPTYVEYIEDVKAVTSKGKKEAETA